MVISVTIKCMRAFLVALAIAVLVSRIYTFNPLVNIIGDGGDNYEFFGFQQLIKENISHFRYPLAKTDTLRYPVGFELGYGYDGALAVFTGALFGLIMPQTLAYNLSIIAILTLNIWFSYIFFRALNKNKDQLTIWIATLLFSLSPYVIARINSHLNLAFIGGFPLLGYALLSMQQSIKHRQTFSIKQSFILFLSILAIAAGSLQYTALVIWNAIILLIIYWFVSYNILTRVAEHVLNETFRNLKQLIIGGLLVLPFILFFYGKYILAFMQHTLSWIDKTAALRQCCQPTFFDVLLPNSYLGSWWNTMNPSSPSIEKVAGIGFIGIILYVIVFITKRLSIWNKHLAIISVIYLLTTIGIVSFPYIPEGGREVVIFSFILSSAIAAQHVIKKKEIAVVILAFIAFERCFFQVYNAPTFPPEASKIVKKEATTAVLDVPTSKFNAYYSILPAFYDKKIVNGYFHYTADDKKSGSFIEQQELLKFGCIKGNYSDTYKQQDLDNTLALLKQNDIRTIVVHKDQKYYFDECTNVRNAINALTPYTVELNTQTKGVQTAHVEESAGTKNRLRFFYDMNGTLSIVGIQAYPLSLESLSLKLPDGKVYKPEWEMATDGLHKTFDIPLEIPSIKGTQALFEPNQILNEPTYVTVWYAFQPSRNTTKGRPEIEQIYSSDDIDIYHIN